FGNLPIQPFGQLDKSVAECCLRFVAEQAARLSDIREAMADISDAVFAGDFRFAAFPPQNVRHFACDKADRYRVATADIEYLAWSMRGLESQTAGASDIVHIDEVALLPPVFKDEWGAAAEIARGENRQHARVGIRQRLARAINIEES